MMNNSTNDAYHEVHDINTSKHDTAFQIKHEITIDGTYLISQLQLRDIAQYLLCDPFIAHVRRWLVQLVPEYIAIMFRGERDFGEITRDAGRHEDRR